jgi:DNA helicase II / ATP-dependent DNA helicase PcrA
VAALHPDPATFEHWLRTVLGRPPDLAGPRVLLSTVHRIKGREWDRVVVFGASAGQFPHRLSDDEEGERRVFHVAITRGREQVAVMAAEDAPSPFVAELDGSRPRRPVAVGGPAPAGGRGDRSRGGPGDPPPGRRERGGQAGEIVELRPDSAVQQVGPARLVVPFGTRVRVGGATAVLARPAPADAVVEAADQALRAWRKQVAAADKVPAYIVFNDRELEGIARAAPRTLGELAGCSGVGPIKLERWGDEVLAVLEAASPAP